MGSRVFFQAQAKKDFISLDQLAENLTENEDKYAREYVPELGKI